MWMHRSGSRTQGDKIKAGRSSDLAQWKVTCEQREGHARLQACDQTIGTFVTFLQAAQTSHVLLPE